MTPNALISGLLPMGDSTGELFKASRENTTTAGFILCRDRVERGIERGIFHRRKVLANRWLRLLLIADFWGLSDKLSLTIKWGRVYCPYLGIQNASPYSQL